MRLDELINLYVVEDDPQNSKRLASELVSEGSLLEIVRALENPLTQEDSIVRSKATECLADVVSAHNHLKAQDLQVLLSFFSDRLHDLESIGPAAKGLQALSSKPDFDPRRINKHPLWNSLKEIDVYAIDRDARYEIYKLLRILLKEPSEETVDVFILMSAGEKDPRNLMMILKSGDCTLKDYGTQLTEIQLESIYDLSFRYFPIKFNSTGDMPYDITAQDLERALLLVLCNPLLAKWSVPGFLSKMNAVNTNVKVQAFTGLSRIVSHLSIEELVEYWQSIWEGTKFEILHGTSETETYKHTIDLLKHLVGIPEFLDAVQALFEAESISDQKLLQLCHFTVEISVKEDIWKKLSPLAVQKCLNRPAALNILLESNYMIPSQDKVFESLLEALSNGSTRESLHGLTRFALTPGTSEYAPLVIQTLTQESAYSSLAQLAPTYAADIQTYCLPELFADLPKNLDALSEVCCVRPLIHTLTVRLLSRLDLTRRGSELTHWQLLNALILSTDHLKDSHDYVGFDRILVMPLMKIFEEAAASGSVVEDGIVDAACILIEKAARGVTVEKQHEFIRSVLPYNDKVHFHLILSCLAPMKEFPFAEDFLNNYARTKLETASSILERAAYLRLFSLVANKWPSALGSANEHTELKTQFEESLSDPSKIELAIWITKGFILRAAKEGFECVTEMASVASKNLLVAKAYGVLAADDRILSKQNGCIVRPLFKQRLFEMSLPRLIEHNNSRSSLVALSGLLKYTPQAIVKSHFAEILPMITSALNSENLYVLESVLKSIKESLPDSAASISPKLDDLVPQFVKLASTSKSPNARLLALQSLISLRTSLPTDTTKYKTEVIDGLESTLSDNKREIRAYAAKCRQAFY